MKKLLTYGTASLMMLSSAQAAVFQDGFPGNALDGNFTLQAAPGFTYGVQPDPPTGVGQLWLYGQWGHSGQVAATTTFYAQGNFTTTVTAWSWAMTQGVYSGGCGNLGLLMSTSQGEASLYLQAAGDMGAAINFPSTASTAAWFGPIDYSGASYDAYQLQISRAGDTILLACYHEGRLYGQLTATDPAIALPAQFSLFLNYPATAGDHTLSDTGWFESLAINADHLGTVPEPSAAAPLLASFTAYILLWPWVAKAARGFRIRRRRPTDGVPPRAPRNRRNMVKTFLCRVCALGTKQANTGSSRLWSFVFLLALPAVAKAQFAYDFTNGTITITAYTGPGGTVVIPSAVNGVPVTTIGDSAFSNCTTLASVTIGTSVTSIGNSAFENCTSLASATIPNSVTSIGSFAFCGCYDLTTVMLPTNLTSIGNNAFGVCGLTSVAIPNSVTNIPSNAFGNCAHLASVTIGNSVTGIGDYAFQHDPSLTNVTMGSSVASIGFGAFSASTSLASVTIPNSVTSIGDWAFSGSSLTSVTIGNNVTTIGDEAFSYSSLTSVAIPNRVASIGAWAFFGCASLASVTIGNSVTNIGYEAFGGCTSLACLTVDALNSAYVSVDGVLFDKSQTTLIQYPVGQTGTSYAIPNSVINIGDDAFYRSGSLTSVTIPNSVIRIGDYAFCACTKLASATIGTNVTSIGNDAFQSCALPSVTFPSSLTAIGDYAFAECDGLTGVMIPKNVASIGAGPFAECMGLSAITVDALNSAYSSVDGVLFNASRTRLIQYPGGKPGTYAVPSSVTNIGDYALSACPGLTSVTVPNSVISIGEWAFCGCGSLASVTIGTGLTTLGLSAFRNCGNLLTGVYFQGNAPAADSSFFETDNYATVYYLPGTTGWGPFFANRPAVLWLPQIQTDNAAFGVRSNQFGFTINWASSMTVAVDACTDLAHPIWYPLASVSLTNGPSCFSDPLWTNYPARFYRLRWP